MAKVKKNSGKRSGKRTTLDPKPPKRLQNENTKWEELLKLKDECVDYLVKQQMLLKELTSKFQETIKNNKEINSILLGTFNSYNDIAQKVRKNMEFHMTIDENNKVIDYKKGKVNPETDDYLNFINTAGNYAFALEQLAVLSANSFTELLTLLNTDGSIDKNDIVSIQTTLLGEQIKVAQAVQKEMEGKNGK